MKTNNDGGAGWLFVGSIGLALVVALSACSGAANSAEAVASPSGSVDGAAAAALPAKYKAAGVINVASDIPFAPMEMLDTDNKLTGFDYDLAQAIGLKLGVRMEFRTQAFDGIVESLQSGKHDVIMSGMSETPARRETLDFVDYLHAGFSILVASGNPQKITNVLDLCGKDVAVQTATVQAGILHGFDAKCLEGGAAPMIIAELPLETDVQSAVHSGRAVAEIVDSPVAAYAAQTAGNGTMFEVVEDARNHAGYAPAHTGIGVLKKDSQLRDALLLALRSVVADGSYAKILHKYALSFYAEENVGINLGSAG